MPTTLSPVRRSNHLSLPVPGYVRHPAFARPTAAELFDPAVALRDPPPAGSYMADDVSRDHAKRMHYAAHRMHTARTRRELRTWQQAHVQLRNRIVVGNRKLIFRAVQAFAHGSPHAEDLAADCHVILIQAVVAFNPWLGVRFSTYAYTCLLRALSRMGKRLAKDVTRRSIPLDTFVEGEPPQAAVTPAASHLYRVEDYLKADHPLLSDREKKVIAKRFNIYDQSERTTLEEVGHDLGLSKERVRQVQAAAITKLRKALTVAP